MTLEQLTPYLPYKLTGIYTLSDVVDLPNGAKDETREKILDIENPKFFLTYCKPILYPLSALTQDKEIRKEIRKYAGDNDEFSTYCEFVKDLDCVEYLSYGIVQILLKHHYNVFNLPVGEWVEKKD